MIWISLEPEHISSILVDIDINSNKYEYVDIELAIEIQEWLTSKKIKYKTQYNKIPTWQIGFLNKGDAMLFKLEWC